MVHQKEIIIFTRYPEPGTTKTRLIPALGAKGAARVQKRMTELIIKAVRMSSKELLPILSVYFTGASHQQMIDWLGPDLSYHIQKGKDLGEKMMHAFQEAIDRGAKQIVLIGSDCPDIDDYLIATALKKLETDHLVLGPSKDGGYYLIGMNSRLPLAKVSALLKDISWGTHDVIQKTLSLASQNGVKVSILKELHDIDLPRDLAYFDHNSNS